MFRICRLERPESASRRRKAESQLPPQLSPFRLPNGYPDTGHLLMHELLRSERWKLCGNPNFRLNLGSADAASPLGMK